jgi:2-C-methyl-D-erythritol 4-phosphate cytidylyltransferase
MTAPLDRLRTVAVVLAGGSGTRVGLDIPKQLLKVAGRTIIEHTVEALHVCDEVDEIVIVMAPDFIPEAERLLLRDAWPKLTRIVAGGRDRNESTRRALDALGEDECNVLFHDAVRPLLSRRVVADCVEALCTYEAVDTAIPSADTIVRVDEDEHVMEIPDRSRLRRGQTPQGFRLSVIRRAYEIAEGDPTVRATDDCGVLLHCLPEVPIAVVRGEEQNLKVTYPVDLFLVDRLFQLSSSQPPAHSPRDPRLAGQVVVLLGGSYGIGASVRRQAEEAGCEVFVFSRTTTGTHVEDAESVAAALREVHERTGRIDAVVVTAGVLERGPLVEMDAETVLRSVAVNYLGPVHAARAAEPYLRASRGHLLLFTSSSYTRGRGGYALYSSTKAAVVNLTQALADEWSDAGVKVNVINPERTRTPMRTQAFGEESPETLLDSDTVAESVLAVLAADLTGHVVDVRLASTTPSAEPAPADLVAGQVDRIEGEAERQARDETLVP